MNNIADIAKALGGARKSGNSLLCCCPVHRDQNPSLSLSVSEGKLLAYCFAGCEFQQIINALKQKGLLDGKPITSHAPPIAKAAKFAKTDKLEIARKIWNDSRSPYKTPVESYLRSRGFIETIPSTLRFHPHLWERETKHCYPAMVAVVTHKNRICGIHRTYLQHDGMAKANITNPKKMLGNVLGGAVYFEQLECNALIVTEGIETALTVYQHTAVPTLACLSTSGMKTILLPPAEQVQHLTIAADNDEAGIKAAEILATKERAKGRYVTIALPPEGKDFNDVLIEGGKLCL